MSNTIESIFKEDYPLVETDLSRKNLTFNKISQLYEKHDNLLYQEIRQREESAFSKFSSELSRMEKLRDFMLQNGGRDKVSHIVLMKYNKVKMSLLQVAEPEAIDAFLDTRLSFNTRLCDAAEYLEKPEREITDEFFKAGFGSPQEKFYLDLINKNKKTFSLKALKEEFPEHAENVEKMLFSAFQETFSGSGYDKSISFAGSSDTRDSIRVKLTPMPTEGLFIADYGSFKDESYFVNGTDLVIAGENYQMVELVEEEALPIEVKNKALTKDITFWTKGLQGSVVVKKVDT